MRRIAVYAVMALFGLVAAAPAAGVITKKRAAITTAAHSADKPGQSGQLLFGDTTIEHGVDRAAAGRAQAFELTDQHSGTANAVHIYVAAPTRASEVQVALYGSRQNQPAARLVTGSLTKPRAGAWNTVALTSTAVNAASRYWVAVLAHGGPLSMRVGRGGACATAAGRGITTDLRRRWAQSGSGTHCPPSAFVTGARGPSGTAATAQPTEPTATTTAVPTSTSQTGSASLLPGPTNTAPPTIGGSAVVGHTLTATTGTWSADAVSFLFQWQNCGTTGATVNCQDILSAVTSSYTIPSSAVGDTLRVEVTAVGTRNRRGHKKSSSVADSAVTGAVKAAGSTAPSAPGNTSAPAVSGTAHVGSALSASTGSWSNGPTGYAYQWRDCDSSGASCSNVSGATSSSYTVAAGDEGHTLDVVVTASNAGGPGTGTSTATSVVPTPAPSASSISFSCPSGARCFFVDYSSGSDANSGTSETSPWRDAPCMRGFTGSYSAQPGDEFIFKGGVTWPNSAFPCTPTAGGNASHSDYYGVDSSWYTGSSFSQPIFNGQGSNIAGGYDEMMHLRNLDYIEIDDIAFRNWNATNLTTGYGSCGMIDINSVGGSGDQNIVINRIAVSGFNVDTTGNSERADCSLVSAYTAEPYAGNSVVENSTFTGNGNTYGRAVYCVGTTENNSITGMIGGIYPCGHGTVSGNVVANCGSPSFPAGALDVHADAIESLAADGAFYIHDNVIHNTGADSNGDECETMFVGNPGETDYVWNNVFYNLNGSSLDLTQNSSPGVAAYIWNNTMVGSEAGTGYCVNAGHPASWPTMVIENNFCITSAASGTDPSLTASTLKVDHNLALTSSQAGADGYTSTETYAGSPTSASNPTVGTGVALDEHCSGAVASLCSDTTYGGARPVNARPSTPWDIGAYQR